MLMFAIAMLCALILAAGTFFMHQTKSKDSSHFIENITTNINNSTQQRSQSKAIFHSKNHYHDIVNQNATMYIDIIDGSINITKSSTNEFSVEEEIYLHRNNSTQKNKSIQCTTYTKDNIRILNRDKNIITNYTIKVPPKTTLQLEAINGSIVIQGIQASITAQTTNGSVQIDEISNNSQITTINGSIRINRSTANLQAKTNNGSITIFNAKNNVQAIANNGSIVVDIISHDFKEIQCKTTNGSIKVTTPDLASLTIDAATNFGSIKTSYPFAIHQKNKYTGATVQGTLASGSSRIDCKSASGTISIYKK